MCIAGATYLSDQNTSAKEDITANQLAAFRVESRSTLVAQSSQQQALQATQVDLSKTQIQLQGTQVAFLDDKRQLQQTQVALDKQMLELTQLQYTPRVKMDCVTGTVYITKIERFPESQKVRISGYLPLMLINIGGAAAGLTDIQVNYANFSDTPPQVINSFLNNKAIEYPYNLDSSRTVKVNVDIAEEMSYTPDPYQTDYMLVKSWITKQLNSKAKFYFSFSNYDKLVLPVGAVSLSDVPMKQVFPNPSLFPTTNKDELCDVCPVISSASHPTLDGIPFYLGISLQSHSEWQFSNQPIFANSCMRLKPAEYIVSEKRGTVNEGKVTFSVPQNCKDKIKPDLFIGSQGH